MCFVHVTVHAVLTSLIHVLCVVTVHIVLVPFITVHAVLISLVHVLRVVTLHIVLISFELLFFSFLFSPMTSKMPPKNSKSRDLNKLVSGEPDVRKRTVSTYDVSGEVDVQKRR